MSCKIGQKPKRVGIIPKTKTTISLGLTKRVDCEFVFFIITLKVKINSAVK